FCFLLSFYFPLPLLYILFPYTTLFRSVFPPPCLGSVSRRLSRPRRKDCRWDLAKQRSRGPVYTARDSGGRPNAGKNRAATSLFRSEEHTSELQSRSDLVCRLLLEKKKL